MAPVNMYGLTSLGSGHTAFSLVAVAFGLYLLLRYKEISARTLAGRVYVVATLVTVLTGFGIFQHGGFGKPHALGIITLIVLAVALVAAYTRLFGRASRYVEIVSYSATYLFHLIPGITETTTRLPFGKPVFASPEAAELQLITGALFVLFLVGAALQVWRMRKSAI
jgi:uncharacterized membrane protein